MTEPNTWAFVKDLKLVKSLSVKCSELWIIEEVSKCLWKRSRFNADDFSPKSKTGPLHYGMVNGNFMHKVVVIELGGSLKDVEHKVKAKRPVKPPRLSNSDAAVPLNYFLKYEEKFKSTIEAKPTKHNLQKVKSNTASSQYGSILKRVTEKLNKTSTTSVTPKEEVTEPCDGGNAPVQTEEDVNLEEGETHANPAPVNVNLTCDQISENNGANEVEAGKEHSINIIQSSEVVTGKGNLVLKQNTQKVSVSGLQDKINRLKLQRNMAIAEATALKLQLDQIKEKAQQYKKEVHILKKRVEELSQGSCKLSALEYAVELEEEFSDFKLPANEVYIGKGRTLVRKKLLEIERHETILSKRGELVFDLINPEGMQNFSKTGGGKGPGGRKKFDETDMKAVKGILSAMHWVNGTQVTQEEMNEFWRRQPCEVARRMKKRKGDGNHIDKNKKKKVDKEDVAQEDDEAEAAEDPPLQHAQEDTEAAEVPKLLGESKEVFHFKCEPNEVLLEEGEEHVEETANNIENRNEINEERDPYEDYYGSSEEDINSIDGNDYIVSLEKAVLPLCSDSD